MSSTVAKLPPPRSTLPTDMQRTIDEAARRGITPMAVLNEQLSFALGRIAEIAATPDLWKPTKDEPQ